MKFSNSFSNLKALLPGEYFIVNIKNVSSGRISSENLSEKPVLNFVHPEPKPPQSKSTPFFDDDDPNGFIRDAEGDGLVYMPDAREWDHPEPINQPKSDATLIEATIRTEMRLQRLLSRTKIVIQFCGLGFLKTSLFLHIYNQIHKRPKLCSGLTFNDTIPEYVIDYRTAAGNLAGKNREK